MIEKGYGLGGLFKVFMRAAVQTFKQGLVHVDRKALKTGLKTLTEVANGANTKTTLLREQTNLVQLIKSGVIITRG